ncbi:MAG: metal ABC transporter substrate-binding protein [Planctomycetota bacterium]
MVLNRIAVLISSLSLVALASLSSCGDASLAKAEDTKRPVVWCASWPIWSLAHQLAGERIALQCALPTDADVEGFVPPRDFLAAMATADLVLLSGAGLEAWTTRANLPSGRVVDTSAGFTAQLVDFPKAEAHSHGPGHAHVHEGTNPHVWLDPKLLDQQARAIHRALRERLPQSTAELDAALERVVLEIAQLDAVCAKIQLAPTEVLVVSHPTWVYLAKRYGWSLVDAHLHSDEPPSEHDLEDLKNALDGRKARAVLFEDAATAEVSTALAAAIGAPVVRFDPDVRRSEADSLRSTIACLRSGVESLAVALAAK